MAQVDESKTACQPKPGKARGCLNLVLLVGVAGMATWGMNWLANRPAPPQLVTLAPAALKPVGEISDRFLSYNVEMVEVTGGRFWRPYKDGKRKGDDRYEYRPPLNLADARLGKLAAALGPAYVRFSGTWANATYFDPDNARAGKAPAGFDTVLTGDQWKRAVAFAKASNARIVTSFATSPGVRDERGQWQPREAERLVAFTKALDAEIAAAEYANEPETLELTQAPKGYTPQDYRRDYGRFTEWMRKASPVTLILAPGAAELGQPIDFLRRWSSGYTIFDRNDLIAPGQHRPDAVSFHFYGAGSQRCGELPVIGFGRDDALSESWLRQIDPAIATTAALRDRVAPDAPLWLTETAEAACGGNPWAATFTDVFRFTDQMARAAKQGVQVYMHNTLSASDYALLDETTNMPRPNYWAAWLWRNLMGTRVLDAEAGTSGLHVYAHCLRGKPGGVAILAINLDVQDPRRVALPGPALLYTLAQGTDPSKATLNGQLLALGSADELPPLQGKAVAAGELSLAPATVNYLAFPQADNGACR